jgi:hypothetical protein
MMKLTLSATPLSSHDETYFYVPPYRHAETDLKYQSPFQLCSNNEKDSPTFDLTVRPLSGAVPASLLLNSDSGAKVKTS